MNKVEILFPILGDFAINPPQYIEIGSIRIYWYGVIIAVGFLLAAAYVLKNVGRFGLTQDNILDMIIFGVPAGIIGARLYYVIFNWAEYKNDLSEIYKIWNGGLAIYGAIIAAVVVLLIYCRAKKVPVTPTLDAGSLGLLIGQSIGRWANFINREAYGSVTELPWRMGLRTTYANTGSQYTNYVHPTFLYESLWNLLGFIFLHWYSKKHRRYDGQIFAMYVAWYGFGRMIIEGLRADSLYIGSSDIRVSQMVALFSCFVALIVLIINRLSRVHRPEELYVNRVAAAAEAEIEETESFYGDDEDTQSAVAAFSNNEDSDDEGYVPENEPDEDAAAEENQNNEKQEE